MIDPNSILNKGPVKIRYMGKLIDPFFKNVLMVNYASAFAGTRGFAAFEIGRKLPCIGDHKIMSFDSVKNYLQDFSPC